MDSFIGWIGGKKNVRKRIIEQFPQQPPKKYVEVFGGAGWVLFGKEQTTGQVEVYNDGDGELVNLFRCVKYHAEEVEKELALLPHSREIFGYYRDRQTHEGLTDIQRAARFFYLVRHSFGCNTHSFATDKKNMVSAVERMKLVHKRLQGVIVENRDFEDLIKLYDSPDTLFYLDPPYFGTEGYYKKIFNESDHYRLFECLKKIKGKFVLSYGDCEFIRGLYHGYDIQAFSRKNTLTAHGNDSDFGELIIRNY